MSKNKEIRYSEVLRKFVHPMVLETDTLSMIEEKYAFGVHVWNSVNIKNKHPELFEEAKKEVIEKSDNKIEAEALFEELVNFKKKEFSDYQRVFIDFEILEKIGGGYTVTAASAELK